MMVKVEFSVNEDALAKLEKALNHYKWSQEAAFEFFCDHADHLVAEMEGIAQGIVKYQEEPWL